MVGLGGVAEEFRSKELSLYVRGGCDFMGFHSARRIGFVGEMFRVMLSLNVPICRMNLGLYVFCANGF